MRCKVGFFNPHTLSFPRKPESRGSGGFQTRAHKDTFLRRIFDKALGKG